MGTRVEVMTEGSLDDAVSEGLISKLPIRVYNIDDYSLREENKGEIRY